MSTSAKARIITAHHIEVRWQHGRLEALDVWTDSDSAVHADWQDVTDATRDELFAWLGY